MASSKLFNIKDFPSFSSNEKGVVKLKLGQSSFIHPNPRTVNEINLKTKLCQNLSNCKYGSDCRFAHSISDITLCNCKYGEKCIFVIYENDNCKNDLSKYKICFYKHPGETSDSYHSRVGNIKKIETISMNKSLSSIDSVKILKDMLETNEFATYITHLSFDELDGLTSTVLEEVKRRKRTDEDISDLSNNVDKMDIE